MSKFRLTDKVAVITGGGRGIGAKISEIFAESGAIVHLLDLNPDNATAVARSIRAKGNRAEVHGVDVSDQASMVRTMDLIARQEGRIDILINNAGIAQVGKLEDTSEADFDRVFQVNVKGVYNSMYAVLLHMKKQKSGVILNMGSIASELGLPDRFGYSMSKGAVLTMSYTVAKDYIADGIRCNIISPARIHTPFVDEFIAGNYPGKESEMFEALSKTQPIGRMGKPEEVANLALYLSSDEASFITGTNFPIDGGFIKLNT